MPKKDASRVRVPLNCLVAPVTMEAVTGIQNETKESQGKIVDRAVALLAFGEEIAVSGPRFATEKQLKRIEAQVTPRAAADGRRGIRTKGDKTR